MTVDDPIRGSSTSNAAADSDGLAALLAEWLPRQRWFAGRRKLTGGVRVTSRVQVGATADARFEHLLVEVPDPEGEADRSYQLWVGVRADLPRKWAHNEIGRLGEPETSPRIEVWYDALHDNALTSMLLTAMVSGTDLGDVRCSTTPGADVDPAAPGLVVSGEQSNTSVIYGQSAILKIFRRLEPGPNPDAEVHAALAERSPRHVARLLGELSGELRGVRTTLGVLTEFFANSADGWMAASASVRDLMAEGDLRADEVGGDFAAEAGRLGEAIAEVHRDLAEAFGTVTVHADQLRRTLDDMAGMARRTVSAMPELTEYAERIDATFQAAAASAASMTLQRIHGDLHLGQTLRTHTGWAIIDFEGEPSKPLEYRRALQSPLRDVAGMLRSFDYAAHHLLPGSHADAQHAFRATEWAARNRRAFCDGYAAKGGGDPRHAGSLLRAFELEKAVYEVRYEHDHRPGWLSIPLHAVAQLTRPGGPS